jgi:cytochrome c556
MTGIVVSFLVPVLNFVGLIVAIVILIKQFKHGGALQGILGIITCTFWTFIWGWIKHRSLQLTKLMVVWTVVSVVPLLLIPVMGAAMFGDILKIMGDVTGDPNLVKQYQQEAAAVVKNAKAAPPRRAKRTVNKAPARNNRDYTAAALALWQDGQYKDPNKAKNYWDKTIAANPQLAQAYNNRGLALYNLGQHERAIADFSMAIQIKPQYAAAYNNRGNAHYALDQYQQAEADFNQSLQLNPKYAKAHLNRGLAFFQMEKITESCSDFKRACDLGECDGLQWTMQRGMCKQ